MNLARGLERRLEKLVDGASASVFRGRMHPIDIASRLVRQVEFLSTDTPAGTQIPNDLIVRMNAADIDVTLDRDHLTRELVAVVTETAIERAWRLVGPVQVQITTSTDVPRGILDAEGTSKVGPVPTWGQLIANDGSAVLEISINRTLIGRSLDSDIRVANQEVSRHHVVIYREDGITMIRDLDSANGTFVNEVRIAERPIPLVTGDTVMLGNLAFTYRPIF
ncbi:MAG: FHA domain-containing protein [Actinomycetia bacterium]|nr:FHA domain-containing protein [Actinomycetes bacterium]